MEKKRDGFGADDYLANLFGGERQGDGRAVEAQRRLFPEPAGPDEITTADGVLWRRTSTGWIRADVDEADAPEWNDAAGDGGEPCAVCGSLEKWTDALDRERCGVCERDKLDAALRLREKAAELRRRHPPRPNPAGAEPDGPPAEKTTPQAARGGAITDTSDSEHAEHDRRL